MMEIFWSFTTLLLVAVFFLWYKYSTRRFDYWKKRDVLYIKPLPFFGNMLPNLQMKKTFGEWLWEIYDQFDKDYFGIFVFDQPVLIIRSPKLIKAIFQKDFTHFDDRTVITNQNDPVMMNLMFFKKNPQWKTVRAKMTPVFTSGKLKQMFPLILNEGNAMTDYISTMVNIPNVEAKEICAKFSTNVTAKCAFAVDAQSFKNKDAEFRKIGRQMFDYRLSTAIRQFGSWFTPNLVKIFHISFFDQRIVDSLKSMFSHILQSRTASKNLKGNDLVDILLELGRSKGETFSDDEILAQAIQFFAAGFETISGAISFTLYDLCIQPEIQEKLRNEIFESIEKYDGITYEAIIEMKYLHMCVSETLRMYPVLPFLDRMCKADYKVEGSNLTIEKGIPVYIPIFGLHYDPKYFPDSLKYYPERFADKSNINNDGLYYVPFGEGPRICIGNRFGLMAVKVGVVSILSKYRLEQTDKTPVPIIFEPKSLVLQSKVGIPLKFVPL